MVTLRGNIVHLRALEPEDLDFLYAVENNEAIWEVSNTQAPYSRFVLRQYLENATLDIYEAKQLRLAICKNDGAKTIGLIDLFDFDPANLRAGVGIIIYPESERSKGAAGEALSLLTRYAFEKLQLHQLYANIDLANVASVALFTNFGFWQAGLKKDWNRREGRYFDEAIFQLIR